MRCPCQTTIKMLRQGMVTRGIFEQAPPRRSSFFCARSCTPSYTPGRKDGVVKDAPGGAEFYTFQVTVEESIAVTSVSPLNASLGVRQTFTVSGRALTSGTGFFIEECAHVEELPGGNTSKRLFACTPFDS